jgi:branched-chain amino acid transport system ATP-binding protein
VAVEAFAAFERNHMRSEETEVIPLAQKYLTAADWTEVDAAFLEHTDPLLGSAAEQDDFRDFFRHIVNLAPPPLGVGPAHA